MVERYRAGLQAGGPAVDYAALYAELDGALGGDDSQTVLRLVATWAAWHDAYWQLRAERRVYDQNRHHAEEE
jgi:hypothetical protein